MTRREALRRALQAAAVAVVARVVPFELRPPAREWKAYAAGAVRVVFQRPRGDEFTYTYPRDTASIPTSILTSPGHVTRFD